MRATKVIPILFALSALLSGARAQNIYGGNPADPDLLESAFSNPALNSFVKDRVACALTTYHVGVAGGFFNVKSGFVSYSFPWMVRGLGVGVQFLNAGMYSQNTVRFSYGRAVLPPLAVGANFDVFSRSFDRSKFVQFDDRDPVFRNGDSKMGISLGFGVAFRASRSLTIGVSFEHLNRPDLAMGSTPFHQPMMFSAGIKWAGRKVNGLSMLQPVRIDDLSGTTDRLPSAAQAGIQIPIERASIRASTDASNATVEAEAPVYGSIFVNYRYSYPVSALQIASSGTHRLGFFVDLDRMPVLSSYPLMPALPPVQVEIRPLPAVPRGFTVVRASTDSVSKMRMNIRRSIEEGIHPRHLALLFPEDLGNLRASMNPTRLTELDLLDVRDPTLRLEGLYTPGYRGAVEGIGLLMTQADVPPRAELLTFSGGERRANALVNVMTGDRIAVKAHVPLYEAEWHPMSLAELESVTSTAQEVQELLYPDHVTFYPAAVFRTLRGSQWWLEIRNAREEIVNSFYGRNELPDSLAWDWRDQNDSVIAPGIYTYLLRIVNGQGETDFSQRGQLRVSYEHRSLAIDVTRKPRIGDKEADRYVIIVGSHGTAPPLPAENPPAP